MIAAPFTPTESCFTLAVATPYASGTNSQQITTINENGQIFVWNSGTTGTFIQFSLQNTNGPTLPVSGTPQPGFMLPPGFFGTITIPAQYVAAFRAGTKVYLLGLALSGGPNSIYWNCGEGF